MSVLRKEESFPAANIADQRRAGTRPDDSVIGDADDSDIGDTVVAAADRRPPQSVAAGDTYDGEIVASSTGPAIPNADPRPVFEPAYQARDESSYASPLSENTVAGSQPPPSSPQAAPDARNNSALFGEDELRDFRARWDQVQTSFVDEPRHAVEQADTLVAAVIKRIADQFAEERAKLEKQWDSGDNISTEDLRQGLKRYRAFFDRLLAF